jgi:hypothetical protein
MIAWIRLSFFLLVVMTFSLSSLEATTWMAPVSLSATQSSPFVQVPEVAIAPSGNAVAVWQFFNGSITVIQGANYTKATNTWTLPATNLSPAGVISSDPQVGMDAAGNAIAVFEAASSIQAAIFEQATSSWILPAVTISTTGVNSLPQVAVNPAGNAIAVWRSTPTPASIQAAVYNHTTGMWSSPTIISTPGQNTTSPQVAINASGNGVAVWLEGVFVVKAALYNAATSTWSSIFTISAPGLNGEAPQVEIDSSGNAVAIWSVSNLPGLQSSTYSSLTNSWSEPVTLFSGGATSGARLSMNASGEAVAVWTIGIATVPEILAATYSPQTGWSLPPTPISTPGVISSAPSVSIDDAGDAIAVWTATDMLQSATYTHATNVWASPSTVASSGIFISPQVALNDSNEAVAVWSLNNLVVQAAVSFSALPPPPPVPPFPNPPVNIRGEQLKNRFASQTVLTNVVCWDPSPTPGVTSYNVFRNFVLVAVVPANEKLIYVDRKVKKHVLYYYSITAVDAVGQSTPISITLP